MSDEANNSPYVEFLRQLSFFCISLTFLISFVSLLGWILKIDILKRFIVASPMMVPRTALSILACTFSLMLQQYSNNKKLYNLGKMLTIAVLVLALEALTDYFLGEGYHVENGLFYFLANTSAFNLLPAPETAICLIFISISLLLLKSSQNSLRIASEVLLLVTGGVGLIAISGYFLGSNSLYSFFLPLEAIGMSLPTALSFVLLPAGVLCRNPDSTFSSLFVSQTSGGEIARKLIAVLFFTPLVVETIVGLLVSMKYLEPSFRFPLMMVSTFGVFLSLSWIFARKIDAADSERLKLRQKLEASEEMYRDLVELAPEGIFMANSDGVYTEVNGAACKMLGYSREELVGLTIKDILVEEEIERFESKEKTTIFDKKTVSVDEWKHKRKDGTSFMSEVCAQMLPGGRWLAFMRNIDERKQNERKILQEQAKYRSLFESLYDGVVVVDSEGTIQMVNPQIERWFGYSPEELIGQKVEVLVPKKWRSEHVHLRESFFQNATTRPMGSKRELYGLKKDGSLLPVDISLSPSTDGNGNVIVTAMIRDVTAQKINEEKERIISLLGQQLPKAQDMRERLREGAELLISSMVDWSSVHLVSDHSENLEHLVLVHRDGIKESWQEIISNSPLPIKVMDRVLEGVKEPGLILRNQEIESFLRDIISEERIAVVHAMGTHSIMIIPIKARERILGIMIMGRKSQDFEDADLEFLRTAVDQIAINADNALLYHQATNSAKMREDLVAIISHDLKSPLSVIRLRSETLAKVAASDKSAEEIKSAILRSTGKIEAAVQRSLTLISDLLAFAKLEAGGFALETKEEDTIGLLQETVEAHIALARAKGISFKIQNLMELPHVAADFSRILQVLSNLVSNAIKFTERGGEVSLEARPFGEEKVLFIVKDTGMGIGEEEREHVFDRYWQPYRNRSHGSGLGLSIAKGIVEAHGGQIWVESKLGIGSSFYFTLPVFQEIGGSFVWKGDIAGQDLRSDHHH